MKKVIVILCFLLLSTSLNAYADEIYAAAANYTGDWASSTGNNADGFTNVGTTNVDGKNQTFDFYIKDVDGGDTEYSLYNLTLSNGKHHKSDLVPTTVSHHMQGKVYVDDGSTTHQPWINY